MVSEEQDIKSLVCHFFLLYDYPFSFEKGVRGQKKDQEAWPSLLLSHIVSIGERELGFLEMIKFFCRINMPDS